MGRKRRREWSLKWCSFFASVAFLAVAHGNELPQHDRENSPESDNSPQYKLPPDEKTAKPACGSGHSTRNRFLMLVSTLDGKISALNLEKDGQLEWSINTGSGDMLSSSISKLEVNRDGRKTRLIPSLDGGLYQYDGSSVEPVPFNADTLLSSSFRLNDNSIVVGGKETETFGIDAKSGKVKYMCDMNGCKIFNKDNKTVQESEETLVVTRNTKTVRAVAMATGGEKWNFSVGQHEVAYITAEKRHVTEPAITDENDPAQSVNLDDDVDIQTCEEESVLDEELLFHFPWWNTNDANDPSDIDIKVIVPSGLVIAMSKSNPNHILWQHKFKTPIANAWNLIDGKLKEVDLFDASNIPALSMDQDANTIGAEPDCDNAPEMPALYIGSHMKQFYVQPSVQMLQAVEQQINNAIYKGDIFPFEMPHITWKPYIATAPSRTPAELQHPLQITWENGEPFDEKSVAIWREYPYDVGYYLFPDFTPMKLNPTDGNNENLSEADNNDFYFDVPAQTLGYWWKEVLAITLVSAVLINVFVLKVVLKVLRHHPESVKLDSTETLKSEKSSSDSVEKTSESEGIDKDKSVAEKGEYQSRYYTDFEQVSCLGKGGFGVVFQTRNRLDDCDYAVKRITLQNSEKAREKVMREVKALAKLDHSGIVRYYQAWLETPPAGWQEEKDRNDLGDISFSPTPGYIVTEYTPSPKPEPQRLKNRQRKQSESKAPSDFNPLKPFGVPEVSVISAQETKDESFDNIEESDNFGGGGDCDISDTYFLKRNGSTEPFIPHDMDFEEDESGSFCFGIGSYENKSPFQDDSFDVIFSDKSNSKHQKISTPFANYSKQNDSHSISKGSKNIRDVGIKDVSFDIVFEDSGCGEKSHDDTNQIDHGHAVIDVSLNSNTTGSSNLHSLSHNLSPSYESSSLNSPTVNSPIATRPDTLDLATCNGDKKQDEQQSDHKALPPPKLYLYIQMQLCKKESLKDWLASNTLNRDRSQTLDIFDQIVSAVDYVHDSGLMHRDLKPSNIFFSLDGTVKIGDFGLVTALEECGEMSDAIDIVRTPASVYFRKHTDQVGTKLYMSPEQIDGRNYTHKVDIYALGLICFELLYPFATQMERVRTMLEVKRLLFPNRFLRELPDECNFVKALLLPDPVRRPSTRDILDHSLLQDFQEARLMVRRIRSTSRSRTFSQSSKDSNPSFSETGSH